MKKNFSNNHENTQNVPAQSITDKQTRLHNNSAEWELSTGCYPISIVTKMFLEEMKRDSLQCKDGITGIASGFKELDKRTSGWHEGQLIAIAGRPGVGKSAFAVSMAKNMALDNNIPVAFFTLEMSGVQVADRMKSIIADIETERIENGTLNADENARLNERQCNIYGSPLFVDESSVTLNEIKTEARRLVRDHGVKVIMIDVLHLMSVKGSPFEEWSSADKVEQVYIELKRLAMELDIPVIIFSQFIPRFGISWNKRPEIIDLPDADPIDMHTDLVCLLHRPEMYSRTEEDENGEKIRGKAELIIAKNRHGKLFSIDLRFVKQFGRFEDWEEPICADTTTAIPA